MSILQKDILITQANHSRLQEVDMDNIPFGKIFSDHMLVARYSNGSWGRPEIRPYGSLNLAPSVSALNYGQAVFEGMKAFRNEEGQPVLFRPEENFKRINRSGHRLCMPPIPKEVFIDGLKELINLDQSWIPNRDQGSLYVRPLYFAVDEYIGVKASEDYIFTIFTCPVGPYYTQPVSLLASRDFVRAAIGGTGAAKAAGNYAGALLPDKLAKQQGYNNVLWLDAKENRYIEECGTMNIFFVIDGVVVTPNLSGTILEGITRNSAIRVLRQSGYQVNERPISIFEIQAAYHEERLQEAFGAGTAATISHIAKIGFAGEDMILPEISERKVGPWLAGKLERIKFGVEDDPYGWVVPV